MDAGHTVVLMRARHLAIPGRLNGSALSGNMDSIFFAIYCKFSSANDRLTGFCTVADV
jgi:hypothetical protein